VKTPEKKKVMCDTIKDSKVMCDTIKDSKVMCDTIKDSKVMCDTYTIFITHYIIVNNGKWGVMVFNATFNNISVISWRPVFIGGGNRSTRRKPPTCRKSLTNFIT
jgi:hypothetical protein